MTNAEFVGFFHGCWYDADTNRIQWDNDGERVYVLIDADGKASSAFASYETDFGDWTDWQILPSQFCVYVNEALAKARELGIGLVDASRAVLDNDLENVVLI